METQNIYRPAIVWRRIAAGIIDALLIGLILFAIRHYLPFLNLPGLSPAQTTDGIRFIWTVVLYNLALNLFITFLYYALLEYSFSATPGAWILGTRIVNRNGEKISFLQALGRTGCRFIPFYWISIIISKYPVAWHDSFSKTLVVPASYTPDNVRAITIEPVKTRTAIIVISCLFALFALAFAGIVAVNILTALHNARTRTQSQTQNHTQSQYIDEVVTSKSITKNSATVVFPGIPEGKTALPLVAPGGGQSVTYSLYRYFDPEHSVVYTSTFYALDTPIIVSHEEFLDSMVQGALSGAIDSSQKSVTVSGHEARYFEIELKDSTIRGYALYQDDQHSLLVFTAKAVGSAGDPVQEKKFFDSVKIGSTKK